MYKMYMHCFKNKVHALCAKFDVFSTHPILTQKVKSYNKRIILKGNGTYKMPDKQNPFAYLSQLSLRPIARMALDNYCTF